MRTVNGLVAVICAIVSLNLDCSGGMYDAGDDSSNFGTYLFALNRYSIDVKFLNLYTLSLGNDKFFIVHNANFGQLLEYFRRFGFDDRYHRGIEIEEIAQNNLLVELYCSDDQNRSVALPLFYEQCRENIPN